MPDDLATLETQRSKLLEEFLGLGDQRRDAAASLLATAPNRTTLDMIHSFA